tara:strand:+ start:1948 stop:2112 length:165 start_codon:yes stop_codon:yes gene_type:complete
MNWINSWRKGNKKEIFEITIRLGRFTILELFYCPCTKKNCKKGRVILLNFGFEV